MIQFSPAKINIGLHILSKREDGYHDISTLFYPVPFHDLLEIKTQMQKGKDFSMSSSGLTIPGSPGQNLCYLAWDLFCRQHSKMALRVHLHKRIPPGAGLGGGSSNGAMILTGLNSLSGNPFELHQLKNMALQLGSDCPFFIEGKPSLAGGRGELLSDFHVDLKGLFLVLLHPGIHVNTAWAYSKCTPGNKRPGLPQLLSEPVGQWRNTVINDFEGPVFMKYPEIKNLKHLLYRKGALYASMSGSGSTVFGLFRDIPLLEKRDRQMVVWQGFL